MADTKNHLNCVGWERNVGHSEPYLATKMCDLPTWDGHTVIFGCEWYHPNTLMGLPRESANLLQTVKAVIYYVTYVVWLTMMIEGYFSISRSIGQLLRRYFDAIFLLVGPFQQHDGGYVTYSCYVNLKLPENINRMVRNGLLRKGSLKYRRASK